MTNFKNPAAVAAALAIVASAAAEPPITVRVRQTTGGPAIHVDGKIVAPQFFYGIPTYKRPVTESPFYRTVAHCRDVGVKFLSFPAAVCWHPPDAKEDWRSIDYLFEQILSIHPDALLVPRIPVNAPDWLMKTHPEWQMKLLNAKGEYYTSKHASVFAHDYRAMAAAHIEKLVRHLRAKFPRNFAGIHPVGQSFGEFFYIDSLGGSLHSFEEPVRREWRRWLAARGKADAATAELPTPNERRRHSDGFLRDPVADRRVVEFSDFEQRELADFVAEIAAAARRGGGGKTLVMFFYGYGFEHVSAPNGAAAAGGYGTERLLDKAAGNIDILCAPFSYVNRRYLAPTMTQSAAESAALRGVMWLDEDDTRTHLVTKTNALELAGNWLRTSKNECIRQLQSNMYACMTRGRAFWWMDLVGDGWYDDRDLWKLMEEMRPLGLEIAHVRKTPFAPEIALLLDERGMLFATAESRPAFDPLIRLGRLHFETCGAPYGQYFASDALAGKLSAKLQFFTSTFFADDETCRAIATQRTMQPNVTRVWCWAPGYLSNAGKDVGNIAKATGFRAKRIAAAVPRVVSTSAGRALGFPAEWAGRHRVDPLFSVEASDCGILACWPDGTPAVAVRQVDKGHEVFMGIPAFTPEVVAGFARLAGCGLHAKPGEAYVRATEDRVFVTRLDEPHGR